MLRLFTHRGRRLLAPLAELGRLAVEAATLLADVCDRYPEGVSQLAEVKRVEEAADASVAELRALLDATLAAPADPRELVALAIIVDDVIDAIDDVADELLVFRPESLPEEARAQAQVLVRACELLADVLDRVHRFPETASELDEVRMLEREGDKLRREAVARLFGSGAAPLEIVRLKAVHEGLERAIDATRDAADGLAVLTLRHRW